MRRILAVSLFVLATQGLLASAPRAEEEKTLNVYNWSEYMPAVVLKQFSKETGIKVNYSTFESNETLYAKLKTLKGKGYDLVVPSTYFVARMRKEDMLLKLDKSLLSNFAKLDPKLLDQPYDPGNEYSIPYLWGTTGIAVNTELVPPGSVKKWADLWDPKYKNSLMLLDDVRDVFSMALKILGHPINTTNEDHIIEAYLKLKEILPNVKLFNSETPKVFLIEEEVSLALTWNGEVYKAARENAKIDYVYPEEGPMIWVDSLAIPKGAKHPENAHKFIDFLLRPETARIVSEELGYATPNPEAIKLLPEKLRANRMIYPTDKDLEKSEIQMEVGDAVTIYQKYWEMLKVAR